MFSKSKRFPEGSNGMMNVPCITQLVSLPLPVYFSAGKDYIPGPGEYEVLMDDSSRHKRYGFLTQTNRFSEGPGNWFCRGNLYASVYSYMTCGYNRPFNLERVLCPQQ